MAWLNIIMAQLNHNVEYGGVFITEESATAFANRPPAHDDWIYIHWKDGKDASALLSIRFGIICRFALIFAWSSGTID